MRKIKNKFQAMLSVPLKGIRWLIEQLTPARSVTVQFPSTIVIPKINATQQNIASQASTKKSLVPQNAYDTVHVVPSNDLYEINTFFQNNKDILYSFLIAMVTGAIYTNKSAISLFRVGSTPIIARMTKEEYPKILEEAKSYYVGIEEYEKAQECQLLLEKHYVNTFIESEKNYRKGDM